MEAPMEGTQTVSERRSDRNSSRKWNKNGRRRVTYTVKLPNGAKFTRLNPVNN